MTVDGNSVDFKGTDSGTTFYSFKGTIGEACSLLCSTIKPRARSPPTDDESLMTLALARGGANAAGDTMTGIIEDHNHREGTFSAKKDGALRTVCTARAGARVGGGRGEMTA